MTERIVLEVDSDIAKKWRVSSKKGSKRYLKV